MCLLRCHVLGALRRPDIGRSRTLCTINTTTSIQQPREPPRISAWTLYFRKLDSLAYIFVADSMGLSSFKFVQWAPKDASMLQQSVGRNGFWRQIAAQGHSRSFILQSVTGRQGVACRHIILLALSLNAMYNQYNDIYTATRSAYRGVHELTISMSASKWTYIIASLFRHKWQQQLNY